MKVADEAKRALAAGFARIETQFQVPGDFSEEVLQAAKTASEKCDRVGMPAWYSGRRIALDVPFVTLDPATSMDLDQAFWLEQEGDQIVLHYALADIAAFVEPDDAIEREAWRRGVTIYSLTEKIPLYPKTLSQDAASLLTDGPRPAVLIVVSIDNNGSLALRRVERIVCRSRAKLSYDAIRLEEFPLLVEFFQRMSANETRRGAIRVEFPQQEVHADVNAPGGVRLALRARSDSELVNSSLSLAVNMVVGRLFADSRAGLFRVMDGPSSEAVARLHRIAHAMGINWTSDWTLRDLQRNLDRDNLAHQRFMLEVRRAGGRASYATFDENDSPWHSAIAAVYSHATAPMRRLADRYVLELALALANGKPPSPALLAKIRQLPTTMDRYETRAANVDRAVIDLLEAVSLQHRIGEVLKAEVVDAVAGIVQTTDSAIRARALQLPECSNGDWVHVRIDAADPLRRKVVLTAMEKISTSSVR